MRKLLLSLQAAQETQFFKPRGSKALCGFLKELIICLYKQQDVNLVLVGDGLESGHFSCRSDSFFACT